MAETILVSGTDVKFIEGATKMTQENWQKYFGALHGSKIVSGLNISYALYPNSTILYDGIVMVNGIMAELKTPDGYTTINRPTEDEFDNFIFLRVYLTEEKVELVRKTGITSSNKANVEAEIAKFIADDSYQCVRNDSIYDVPLFYGARNYYNGGIYLGRRGVMEENIVAASPSDLPMVSDYKGVVGRNKYSVSNSNGIIPIRMDVVNIAEDIDLYFLAGSSTTNLEIFNYPQTAAASDFSSNYQIINLNYDTNDWADRLSQYGYILRNISASSGLTHVKIKLISKGSSTYNGVTYPTFNYAIEVL